MQDTIKAQMRKLIDEQVEVLNHLHVVIAGGDGDEHCVNSVRRVRDHLIGAYTMFKADYQEAPNINVDAHTVAKTLFAQSMELEGVIADWDYQKVCDAVCARTVLRVSNMLHALTF